MAEIIQHPSLLEHKFEALEIAFEGYRRQCSTEGKYDLLEWLREKRLKVRNDIVQAEQRDFRS